MTWTDILVGLLQMFGIVLLIIAGGIFLLMLALVAVGLYDTWKEREEDKKNGLR